MKRFIYNIVLILSPNFSSNISKAIFIYKSISNISVQANFDIVKPTLRACVLLKLVLIQTDLSR